MLLHYTAMSSPGAGTESPNFLPLKTAVFSSKPAGEDMASPLHHRGGKLFDKREFERQIGIQTFHGCRDENGV